MLIEIIIWSGRLAKLKKNPFFTKREIGYNYFPISNEELEKIYLPEEINLMKESSKKHAPTKYFEIYSEEKLINKS